MLNWACLAVERWMCASASRMAKHADRIPLWLVPRATEAKLVRTLRYVWRSCEHQRERWQAAGIRYRDLRSPRVLARIPFMTGADLAERPEAFTCVPREQLIHLLTSSGTTGVSKKVYLTADDLALQVRMIGAHLRRLPGVSRAAAMFNVEIPTWATGTVTRLGIEQAGMFGLLASTRIDPAEQAALLRQYDIDLVISMPAYIHRMTLEVGSALADLGVKFIIIGGQSWSEDFRAEVEEAWGATLLDSYGMVECVCGVSSECERQDGLHVSETCFRVEIVDPETGEPLADGTDGEIVVTTLNRTGMPLVRYRTGDLAHLRPRGEACACGRPFRKMSRIRGRRDDMLILGGDANIWPDEIDRAVFAVGGIGDYRLTVEEDGYHDVIHLDVEADDVDGTLAERLVASLRTVPYLRIIVDQTRVVRFGRIAAVPRGSLSAGRAKSVRIVDTRTRRGRATGAAPHGEDKEQA